jgi:flavin-binding protein dodecin
MVLLMERCTPYLLSLKGRGTARKLATHCSLLSAERKESQMAESVYSVITLVGTSNESWEKAAAVAIAQASQTLRGIRVARIIEQDLHIEEPGKSLSYRVKMELSFKYESGDRGVGKD